MFDYDFNIAGFEGWPTEDIQKMDHEVKDVLDRLKAGRLDVLSSEIVRLKKHLDYIVGAFDYELKKRGIEQKSDWEKMLF